MADLWRVKTNSTSRSLNHYYIGFLFAADRPTPRFCSTTKRLPSISTRGCVSSHASGGRRSSGMSGPLPPRNRNTNPPGRTNAWSPFSTRDSTRTARNVSTSCASCSSARVRRDSNRAVSTSAPSTSRCRQASRRNAARRTFDSTMSKGASRSANFIGMAGDPAPDPMSTMRFRPAGR